ncbi:SAMHD1 [Symbiodinium microadriaticum]|nr:SAMHD1 [Symbiodinium microadriaticum]
MFEVFMHQLGHDKWSHEQASVVLVKELLRRFWPRLSAELGLGSDAEGDDQQLIQELIDPPKAEMEKLKEGKRLKEEWGSVLKGRTADKAWIYEIVSNWRTGIDVDKFDYFRRDALFLGIGRQHDHNRYMKSVKVIFDEDGLKTISPPEKDKDHIRENILELRKTLHRFAYQHKTVKKLEQHMIDILMLFNKHATVTGTNKRRMSIAEAALEVDLVAYPKLTDMLVETRLLEAEEEGLKEACQLYQKTFIQRKLMRNVLIWWLPPAEEVAQRLPTTQQFLREMWELYDQSGPSRPSKDFARDEVRCVDAKLHCGMKQVDPIKKIVFHDKQGQPRLFEDHDANPLRQKFFVLWSPPDELEQTDVPQRLSMAAMGVASTYTTEPETTPVSPLRRKSRSGDLEASPPPSTPKVRLRQKRQLQVESSYPVNTEIFERKPA